MNAYDTIHRRRTAPGRTLRRRRQGAPMALFGLALTLSLAACGGTTPPPPPPAGVALTIDPPALDGVTTASLQVRASGSWSLSATSSNTALADAVAFTPTDGSGDASATLDVDPSGVAPGSYDLTIVLDAERAGGGTTEVRKDVGFSFPEVHGVITQIGAAAADAGTGDGAAAADGQAASAAAAFPAFPLGTAEGLAPSDVNGAPVPTAALGARRDASGPTASGAVLLVGLEAADPLLRAAGAPGRPSERALAALTAELATVDGARLTSSFEAAGIAVVRGPGATDELAARLRATPGVRYVERPMPLFPFATDEFRSAQWNLERIGAETAWQLADGSDVTIAVLDTGFYPEHPDLAGNVVGTYDAVDGGSDVTVSYPDCGTHGTHVAGVAAAVTDNGIGVAGVARGAGLLLVDLGDEASYGCPMDTTRLIDGLAYVENGGSPRAQVVNLSLGSADDLGVAVRDALVATKDAGVTIVGAAGNSTCPGGADTFTPVSYPAAYPEVLAIAATGAADERACYSHVGGELWLSAPGGNSARRDATADMILSTVYDFAVQEPTYAYMEGTSMAAPAVAAVAAMLLDAVPTATPDDVARAMADSAVDLGDPGRDTLFGYGLVDAPAALALLTGDPEPEPEPGPEPDPATLYLRVPGYPDSQLDADGIFTLIDAPLGPLTITAGSDENGNGVLGDSGEYYGQVTIEVAFDQPNEVALEVERQP